MPRPPRLPGQAGPPGPNVPLWYVECPMGDSSRYVYAEDEATALANFPRCATHVTPKAIRVTGTDYKEVLEVTRTLTSDAAVRQQAAKIRSPWLTGTFYLLALAVIIALLLAAGRLLPIWALPVVLVGAPLLLSVVGAFQLRQDDRLTERGFLKLMTDALRQLPLLLRPPGRSPDDTGHGAD